MIAPFWADVHLGRAGGTVWYRVTTENTIKQQATNDVKTYFPRFKDFQASWIFISTWESVPFYSCSYWLGCLKVLYTKDSLIISFRCDRLGERSKNYNYPVPFLITVKTADAATPIKQAPFVCGNFISSR